MVNYLHIVAHMTDDFLSLRLRTGGISLEVFDGHGFFSPVFGGELAAFSYYTSPA